ncbi:MAG: membrane-bound lytic murein transglycosylase MltF, partial [Candidatus Marinimicrobia bacterium]|nr:membrane-bound lytic murein transglycosylase MltF [Candidatus Neomarinimicrobiota bacterium]
TPARENMFLFGPDYFSTHLVLIVHKDNMSINSVQKLTECKALIPKGASYQETLNALRKGYPGMGLEITENLSIEQVIEKVALKEYSCTIADENIFEINQRFFPDLRTTAVLSDEEYFAWMIGREGNELNEKIHEWFEIFQESGRYDQVIHKYYGHTKEFDYVDVRTFHNKILKVLPKYKKIFELAAEQTNLEWSLLAALAYQESHWKKYAKSPTGVRGIMMLTQKTASEVDVKNRLNPEESILGGAKYLKKLIDRVPDTVHPDDKILFALAAYNIGMGHIYDVRKVAGWFNKDPDSWMDIKSVLPLLSQKEYYKKLKYGYARGQEPVDYVDRIINYKEILDNFVGEYFAEPAKKK